MLMQLKRARKEFAILGFRVDYEKCCNRKRAAYALADKERALAAYTHAC